MTISEDILNFCIALDNNNDPVMTDCNAFVKKVGAHFNVQIPDLNADGIIDAFSTLPFTQTSTNPTDALAWAKNGLVVAGMKQSELSPAFGNHTHGHVAIVHAGEDTNHPGFPLASWGSLGGRGLSNTSIRQTFPASACNQDKVHFAFVPVADL